MSHNNERKSTSLDLVSVFWSAENKTNKLKQQQCIVLRSMSHRYPVRTYTLSPNTWISATIIFNVTNPERQCLWILLSRLTAYAEKITYSNRTRTTRNFNWGWPNLQSYCWISKQQVNLWSYILNSSNTWERMGIQWSGASALYRIQESLWFS